MNWLNFCGEIKKELVLSEKKSVFVFCGLMSKTLKFYLFLSLSAIKHAEKALKLCEGNWLAGRCLLLKGIASRYVINSN